MDVIEFLFPEMLCTDGNGMSGGLPKPAVSVRAGRLPEDFGEHGRLVSDGVVGQHPASVTPEGVEGLREAGRIVPMIKDYRVQVRRHDDVGVDAQPFLRMAEGEAVRQKTARPFTHEHGQPGHDAVGDKIDQRIIVYAVRLHGNRVVESGGGCTAKGRGDLRSEEWHGPETMPQQGNWKCSSLNVMGYDVNAEAMSASLWLLRLQVS